MRKADWMVMHDVERRENAIATVRDNRVGNVVYISVRTERHKTRQQGRGRERWIGEEDTDRQVEEGKDK